MISTERGGGGRGRDATEERENLTNSVPVTPTGYHAKG